mmetsp:Transcript_56545/g.157576  ORF Transcript_56545/g.157576 Transcript_56545/m.157576 type:complete len:372 (+) Transcript_56545:57-1172(+)
MVAIPDGGSDDGDVESAMNDAPAPCASFAATCVVGVLMLAAGLLSFALQLVCACLTWPLLLCSGRRGRFYHIQSYIFRTVSGLLVVGLNPIWGIKVRQIGSNPGPPASPPGSATGCVFFVNHRSNADPYFVAWLQLRLCIEARYIYKSSLSKVPILGWCALLAGDLRARFGDKDQIKDMLDRARELLRQGYHLVVFPEGTRSPSGVLQRFKPSFFEICAELGAPAVPVCLLGTERAWPHSGLRFGCASVVAAVGEAVLPDAIVEVPIEGEDGERRSSAAAQKLVGSVEAVMRDLAEEICAEQQGSSSTAVASENDAGLARRRNGGMAQDPLVTGRPYPWWKPPEFMQSLTEEEQLKLLREARAHERGAHLL